MKKHKELELMMKAVSKRGYKITPDMREAFAERLKEIRRYKQTEREVQRVLWKKKMAKQKALSLLEDAFGKEEQPN